MVVWKVLGSFFVSSESFSYISRWVLSKVGGHEKAIFSLKILGEVFSW